METQGVYKDIAARTGGDIYIGVVGPVRTGKSTFIKKFMEELVLPQLTSPAVKNRGANPRCMGTGGRKSAARETPHAEQGGRLPWHIYSFPSAGSGCC